MLEAVNIGWSQPATLVLSRRRSRRRLRWLSCWRILAFTRNPILAGVMKTVQSFKHRRKIKGFRVFSLLQTKARATYACSRASTGPDPVVAGEPETPTRL